MIFSESIRRKEVRRLFNSELENRKADYQLLLSKAVRILTVPPVLVSVFVFILYKLRDDVFYAPSEIIITLLCLALFPVLAYPVSYIIPALRRGGRKSQRNLAFILSFIGYSAALIVGLVCRYSENLISIILTYELSVLILLLFNKGLKIKASGHACSVAGPAAVCTMFFGWKGALIGLAVLMIVFWASLKSKRHSFSELVFGSLASIVSTLISFLLI